MSDIKVYENSDKMEEAYQKMVNKMNEISKEYQLTFFELFGIIEAYKTDLIQLDIYGEEDSQ